MTADKKDDGVSKGLTSLQAELCKTYDGAKNLLQFGEDYPTLHRIPTGVYQLDKALGGGLPRSRLNLAWGGRSSLKTTLYLNVMKNLQRMCRVCFLPRTFCTCKLFLPHRTFYMNVESIYNPEWVDYIGVNVKKPDGMLIANPEYAEQAVDMLDVFINSGLFDGGIIDSLAGLCPQKEREETSENWQQGLHARIVNKAMRRWVSSICSVRNKGLVPLTLCMVNQVRMKIGVMFGDPRVKPAGEGQDFATSTEIFLSSGQVDREALVDVEHKVVAEGSSVQKVKKVKEKDKEKEKKEKRKGKTISRDQHFQIKKNNTGLPELFGDFKVHFDKAPLFRHGEEVLADAKKHSIVVSDNGKLKYKRTSWKVSDLVAKIDNDFDFYYDITSGIFKEMYKK